jgi:hypothetical protein
MAALGLPLMRNRPQINALDKVYSLLCKKLARKGHPKAAHEGPLAYGQRLQSSLQAQEREAVQKFLALYAAAKYGKSQVPQGPLIARLRTLLAQCPS